MKYFQQYQVASGSKVKLRNIDPQATDAHESHLTAAQEIVDYQDKLRKVQDRFYADGRRSLLICLQGMDTSGKDGTINHILGAMNPQSCRVVSFKQPSLEEKSHDFLWRIHHAVPAKGQVVIFNRSHYEDVLVVRVHNLVPEDIWSRRFDQINAFEKGLKDNHTHILKFYLHISKAEQLKRFKERLDDPHKRWKISDSDYTERKLWDNYETAYEETLSKCSTSHAPWFVIPSDRKWFRNLAIGRILVEYLEGLDLKFPQPTVDLERIRREYHEAEKA